MAIQYLTLSQIEEAEKGAIWVLNNAQKSIVNLPGELLINIPTAQGKADILKIPQSWLPSEATARFPRKRVLESTEFRGAVLNELILLISEEEAARIMKEDGAAEERKRLRDLDTHIRQAGAPRKISDANVEITNPNSLTKGNTTPVDVVGQREETVTEQIKAGVTTDKNGMKPNFMAFFERMKTQGDIEALNSMRNKGRFSRRELRYLRDNLPNHPKTVKNIKSRLIELKKESATAE